MDEKEVKIENRNIDSTLDEISRHLKPDETLIFDIGSNDDDQTDIIYDKLVMRGYSVKKMIKNGNSHIIVSS
jgi:tRNA splicing endonuclease